MVDVIPVSLAGNNLGERHRCLNNLIINAHQENVPLQSILDEPEVNPIDRVLKIKLASKYRHVDFIIENLKSKDMLYVSIALKNMWLFDSEYKYIINPVYLESYVYPEMITTAVNKMKSFLELKLKVPERCQEFYEYYKSNFDTAIKFLWHCTKEFIIVEVPKILDKLTPKHLRILCETCPQVARLYFEGLQNNKVALSRYYQDKEKYFKSILNVLKADGNLFLDILENYFDYSSISSLSSSATRYIMKGFKNRYLAKPELYAAWLLHVKTLARFLTSEEIKDIVIKLARAQYLNRSFTYQAAEPFIKCLNAEERASIKKQVFIDKSIGTMIETWPYPVPEILKYDTEPDCEPFGDIEHKPYEYEFCGSCFTDEMKICIKKKKRKMSGRMLEKCCFLQGMPHKSSLDQLFERYRFTNFDKTFFEIRKLLLIEGTIEGRRNMMLVLVSKSGGNIEKLEQLLKFLVERHSNEPVHLREAVARSMVKRAFIWRLPSETWDLLMKWATTSVSEVLHSSILRHLLSDSQVPPVDLTAYLDNFSDLTTYSLNTAEKACIVKRLPVLLINANAPVPLLDTIEAYKLRVNAVPGAIELLTCAARKDKHMLQRLFTLKIARKHLLKETFTIYQTDAAFVNALKHDLSVLENGESFAALVNKEKPNHDRFLRALVLYFSEPDGLAVRHRIELDKNINEQCAESLARPLAFLFNLGNESFNEYIQKTKSKTLLGFQRKLAAAVRANAFVVRPALDLDVVDWHSIGAKFVSNNVLLCSDKDVEANIQKCLIWKNTIRIALRLATRSKYASDVFAAAVRSRPIVALKIILSDMRKRTIDLQLWNQVKPIISDLDLSKDSLQYIKRSLGDSYLTLTSNIEADYWTTVYRAFYKISDMEAMTMLSKIEILLHEVDEDLLKQIILIFLRDKLNKDMIIRCDSAVLCLYFRIIAKYLITSENDHIQKVKKDTVCDPFFDKIEILWPEFENDYIMMECLDDFIFALKYSKAFLNTKYVSCMPMFENILERLRKILPRERYFEKYVCIHLTMLYYKSIRQALKQKPEIFEDPTLMRKEGVKLVGFMLGKYVGIEIQKLVQSYFNSVIEVYKRGLVKFVSKYFEYNTYRATLVMSMIRGLIEGGFESQVLAQYVFEKEHSGYVNNQEREEIFKLLKNVNNEEMKFFLYANIYPY